MNDRAPPGFSRGSASEALGRTESGSKPTYDELLARVAQLEQELHASFPAESVQRTTLQRFYSVLSSMYSGVLLVTDDGRVEFANPAFCERFGLKDAPADLIGLGSGQMIEKIKNAYAHPDEAVVRIREILDRGQPVRGEEIEMQGGGTCLRDFVPLRVDNADRNRLAQVIGNLLQNAAKFTGRGGETRITIRADATEKRAVIQVVDTGVGMAPDMVSRLFQPFSQADATLDRSKGGLGLGLALAKGLVELHGGTITAASAGLGQGAEFVVRLPLATEEALAPRSGEDTARARRRVLIIEDNVDAADSLRDVLAFGEHEVEVAYNGPQGIAKAQEFLPEVVLCDIGLPGMDGYEVARAFQAENALRGAFLVALTGYALPEDLERAQAAGFKRHLAKPPSLEKLMQILAEVP